MLRKLDDSQLFYIWLCLLAELGFFFFCVAILGKKGAIFGKKWAILGKKWAILGKSGRFWEKVGDFGKKKVDKKIFRAAAAEAAAAEAAANKNTNKLRFQESLVAELLLLLLELSGKLL